ncbi:hypothetical protein [Planctomycetes bacterium TBK1r]|uniref:Uncharacterized protein n=1 Tax=Stieleria magnilauensis TaxID=2527963 RepID=A0ABX5XVW3_9BACT|nr:hypothetical protein TBK1r_47280 [Planctomycetes bacterium TBK1r]
MKLMTRNGIRRIAFERLERRDLLTADAFADIEFDFDSEVHESSVDGYVALNEDGDREYRDDDRADHDHSSGDHETDDDDFDDDHNPVVSFSPLVQPQTTTVQPTTSLNPADSFFDNGFDRGNETTSAEGESASPDSEDSASSTEQNLAPTVLDEGEDTAGNGNAPIPADAAATVVADKPPADSRDSHDQAVPDANSDPGDPGDSESTSGDHESQAFPEVNELGAATESSPSKSVESIDPIAASVQNAVADESQVAETTPKGFATDLVARVFRGGSLAMASLPTDFEAIDRVMNQLLDEIVADGGGDGVEVFKANLATVAMSATIGVIAVELVRRRGKLMRRDGADDDALVWMFPEISGLPGAGS